MRDRINDQNHSYGVSVKLKAIVTQKNLLNCSLTAYVSNINT